MADTPEHRRIQSANSGAEDWRLWGPYLSERQWGTVREDYSADGAAWAYFPHDHARSRAYRWGEDGIAGISDAKQRLCFALAFWNGNDPILKERLFGLANGEGNHGEDVKELYYYLDATPSHAYLKMLYKYPQCEYPYAHLVEENMKRGINTPEYEIFDTDAFAENRYFDIFVEYAKAGPEDILVRITAHNRGPEDAPLHILPHLWFRNTWSWHVNGGKPGLNAEGENAVVARHIKTPDYRLYFDGAPALLFTENETNAKRIFGKAAKGFFKDAFHDYVIDGESSAVNPSRSGTKCAAHYAHRIKPGESVEVRARLCRDGSADPFGGFDAVFADRVREADAFYDVLEEGIGEADLRLVQRHAFAGMIWTKQYYHFDVSEWLEGDEGHPPPPTERREGRNREWGHLYNADVISMPDKWEYPWYAAWDVAFHCIPLAMIDAQFAKDQLVLLTREWYMHPNGQLPAYEWALSDANPPVHAWATWRVFQMDRKQRGDEGDLAFLERVFHKLLINFTWWVNRKDVEGKNVFQGGFLGLDNIGVFDRSQELPSGGHIRQSDGTSWMAMYSLNLMRIALELAKSNPVYQDIATKFFEHFLSIAEAMTSKGHDGVSLWDEEDEFYYDVLNLADGTAVPLKLRSMVGLIPLFAVETIEPETLEQFPEFAERMTWYLENRPNLANLVSRWEEPGKGKRHLLSLLRGHRMKMLLKRMLDPNEFLSDYGVRAMSKVYEKTPYTIQLEGQTHTVTYTPAESNVHLFGGNSNWRGPIWFPVNFLLIESLQRFHHYYGDDFKVEHPTGSGNYMTIQDVAADLADRLVRIFRRNADGRRPVYGDCPIQQADPYFKDYILFYEYFHGDTGRGVGASHQTGWTGLVAKLIQPRAKEC